MIEFADNRIRTADATKENIHVKSETYINESRKLVLISVQDAHNNSS